MKFDKDTVARVARLARIATGDAERQQLAGELSSIIEWIDTLGEVDTDEVEPMSGVGAMTLKRRRDEVTDGGVADDITANAPASSEGCFVVPKIVE